MAQVATGASGQLYYTEAGSSIPLASMKTVNGRWVKFVNGGNITYVVYDITRNTSFITFTNVAGQPGYGNTLNGQSSMSGIETQLIATFNDSSGGGGGGNVTVVSSVLPDGAATEVTLQAVLTALTGGGTPQVVSTTSVNASGNVAAGKYSILFELSIDYTGNIDGVAYTGANVQSKSFTADSGRTLPSIAYTVATGSIIITTIA